MNHGEKLGKLIYLERILENKSRESKSLNLDQVSRRNYQVNKREIFEIKNREKLKLKLTKIMIQN